MTKGLIFFCCACAILLFTIINLSIGPIISGRTYIYGTQNCAQISDNYDNAKKGPTPLTDIQKKYTYEWKIDECNRKKAMYNMEYTSFIFDIVIGFVCSLLGLLHHFEVKKDFVSKTGLIGLVCGFVGFVLTFVYVILNGIVYTSYYDDNTIPKTDSKGVFAEWKGNKYECLYFDEPGNDYAFVAKYSDLIKKQYNYNKNLKNDFTQTTSEAYNCKHSSPGYCDTLTGYITTGNNEQYAYISDSTKKCNKLYYYNSITSITNKDKSQRFLTALILSLIVCLANIGLLIFGLLLFRTPGEF